MPVPVTREELEAIAQDIYTLIKEGDSFEGFFNYLMPDLDSPEEVYAMVEARYRIGNSMGQGGMRIIGEWKEVPDDH